LASALKVLGVKDADVSELASAVAEDAKRAPPSLGQRTGAWLKGLGTKLGEAGILIGVEVAKEEAKKWILQYLGIPPS
jgi:hypothetical protein